MLEDSRLQTHCEKSEVLQRVCSETAGFRLTVKRAKFCRGCAQRQQPSDGLLIELKSAEGMLKDSRLQTDCEKS
jgi:hypothetical protein